MGSVSHIFDAVRRDGRKNLLEPEAKEVCRAYEIPVTDFRVAKEEAEAIKAAGDIGYPVVLKIVSPDVIHKSDVGAVVLNLKTAHEVGEAYRRILSNVVKVQPNARMLGVLVQEMAPASTEVIVGAIKDQQFGPSIMFGLGGILVEVLEDVAFRVAPVTMLEAEAMITEIKAYPVLKGYRNQPKLDTAAIAEVIVKTSKLVMDHQDIKELDLNPVMVYEDGVKTVDARIILE